MPERRNCSRFPSHSDRRAGELCTAWRRYPVTIDNESAGGYGVTVNRGRPKFTDGQHLDLLTSVGRFPVSVIYLSKISGGLRVGLIRRDEETQEHSRGGHRGQWPTFLAVAIGSWLVFKLILGSLGWL